MRLSTPLSLLLAPLSVSAIITGLTAPPTITPNSNITLTLTTSDYIQAVTDVSCAFGIAPGAGYPDSLGTLIYSAYLGPALSNTLQPIPFTVQVPAGTQTGPALVAVAVTSLYGVDNEPVVNLFNTTVTVV
jgi:hypothetical protein